MKGWVQEAASRVKGERLVLKRQRSGAEAESAGSTKRPHHGLLPTRNKAANHSWNALLSEPPSRTPSSGSAISLRDTLPLGDDGPEGSSAAERDAGMGGVLAGWSACLSNLNLCPRSATGLALNLRGNSVLETLDISRNCVGDPGTTALAAALKTNRCLETLEMGSNGMSVHGVECLGNALAANRTLRVLEISFNGVGDEGAEMLSRSLPWNSTLQHIGLGFNGIMERGASALAKSLQKHSSLVSLELSYNAVCDLGAASLARALAPGCALRTLRLNSNSISDQGAASIAEALEEPGSEIETLELAGNSITNVGATRLAEALWKNSRLRTLRLEENLISEHGRAMLKAAEMGTWCVTEIGDELKVAVAMGHHKRLGAGSWFGVLSADLLQILVSMCAQVDKREVICYPKVDFAAAEEDLDG